MSSNYLFRMSTELLDESLVNENKGFSYERYSYGYKPYHFMLPPSENEDYGLEWPDGTLQITKEQHGYYVGGIGGMRKFDHLINMIRLKWPDGRDGRPRVENCIEFCNDGILNTSALRVLWACCYEKDLGVAGSASSGKTRPIAAYIISDWECAPDETLIFVATTSLAASEDRIYGAIVQLYNSAVCGKHGTLIDYKKCIVFGGVEADSASDREYNNAIKAMAIENGLEGRKAVDTTRGRKNKRVRLIIDELPEMGSYVIQARVNLASNPNFQFIGIGNPAKMDDPHGELCRPDHADGYKSVNKNIPEWKTRTGKCIFLSGEWSPNFLVNESEPVPYPYLTNRQMLADMLTLCYGNADSIEYMRNAIGFWPSSTSEQTILTRNLIEAYDADEPVEWLGTPKKSLCGLDLGFTVGGDEVVGIFGHLGQELSGRKILVPTDTVVFQAKDGEIFEKSIARQVVEECIKRNVDPDGLGLDIQNDGGKIAVEIIAYWSSDPDLEKRGLTRKDAHNIRGISSGGKPTERTVSELDPVPCTQRFDRRVTEYWMACRLAVLNKVIKGIRTAERYVSDLCTRTYEKRRNERLYMETKPDYKERMKGVSPDHGDAFSYFVEMGRHHGLEFILEAAYRRRVNEKLHRKAQAASGMLGAGRKIGTYSTGGLGEKDC